jgi:hypothetical protein
MKNVGQKVDHENKIKDRFDCTVTGKYSRKHEVPVHHGDDNTMKGLTEQRFPRRIPPTGMKSKPRNRVWPAASMANEDRLYTIVRTMKLLCAWIKKKLR